MPVLHRTLGESRVIHSSDLRDTLPLFDLGDCTYDMFLLTYLAALRDAVLGVIIRITGLNRARQAKVAGDGTHGDENSVQLSDTDLERGRVPPSKLPATLLDAAQRALDYRRVVERLDEICRKGCKSQKTLQLAQERKSFYQTYQEQAQSELVGLLTVSDLVNVRDSERKAQTVIDDLIKSVEDFLKAEKTEKDDASGVDRLKDVFVVDSDSDVEEDELEIAAPSDRRQSRSPPLTLADELAGSLESTENEAP